MEVTDRLDACLAFTLLPQNDGQPYHVTKGDPGKGTAWGVIQSTYDVYRGSHKLPHQSVSLMTPAEREDIYRSGFWTPGLPAGVDLMVFDFAVTSGAGRSREFLQEELGFADDDVDGVVGPMTLAAVSKVPSTRTLVAKLGAKQEAFYKSLSTWSLFGRGWTNRETARTAAAMKMVSP